MQLQKVDSSVYYSTQFLLTIDTNVERIIKNNYNNNDNNNLYKAILKILLKISLTKCHIFKITIFHKH